MDSLNIDQIFFFRCIEYEYKTDKIIEEGFTKSPTRYVSSLALSTWKWEKNLVGNIKDEFLWKNF